MYILLMVLPIVAGQMACNQGLKFHRMVARLYNTIITIGTNYPITNNYKNTTEIINEVICLIFV